MTRINIDLDPELHKKAKLCALLSNTTLIEYIAKAISDKNKKTKGEK